jgi:hypothetical protein
VTERPGVSLARRRDGVEEEEVGDRGVRDERLRAVEHVVAVVRALGRGLHRVHVGARVGLGCAVRADEAARRDVGQVAGVVLGGA